MPKTQPAPKIAMCSITKAVEVLQGKNVKRLFSEYPTGDQVHDALDGPDHLYAIHVFKTGEVFVECKERDTFGYQILDPKRTCVIHDAGDFVPVKATIKLTSPSGGSLTVRIPTPKGKVAMTRRVFKHETEE